MEARIKLVRGAKFHKTQLNYRHKILILILTFTRNFHDDESNLFYKFDFD